MQPGDLVQAQKYFWAEEIGASDSKPCASKISISPGDILLLIDIKHGTCEYPIYNYFTIKFFTAGSRWSTSATIEEISEVEDYIQVFESPTLLPRG